MPTSNRKIKEEKEPIPDGRNIKYSACQKSVLLYLSYFFKIVFSLIFIIRRNLSAADPADQEILTKLPNLLIFLHRLTGKSDAELLKDILIHIGQHNRRVDLAAAEFRELL